MNRFPEVLDWNPADEKSALSFLQDSYHSTMFLLGNFEAHGPSLTDHPNSGNFKLIRCDGAIVGVFCLTRRGNLLVHCPAADERVRELILGSCAGEGRPIQGVLGPWELSSTLWSFFSERGAVKKTTFRSKEILYALRDLSAVPLPRAGGTVRLLQAGDYARWRPFRLDYLAEEGLRLDLTEDELRKTYDSLVEARTFWGYFEGEELRSMAGLNAKAFGTGQVGGVFTPKPWRRRGYSRETMLGLLRDCRDLHGIGRMILFTGENNLAAQRLYEGLGFERIGHFGLFFA